MDLGQIVYEKSSLNIAEFILFTVATWTMEVFLCREILYIGQAENIRLRHTEHEKRELFMAELRPSEVLFYSCAPVAKADLDRVENALVFEMHPKLNDKLTETFPYDSTTVVSDGQCSLLKKQFTVERKDK